MRKQWLGWLLAAMAWAGVASAEVEVPVIENAGYTYCLNEAISALWVARLPTVFGRTRTQLDNDPTLPPYLRGMVSDYFSDEAAGRVPTYAHFAQHRFQDCLGNQKLTLDAGITETQTFACITRMDVPFFFFMLKRSGETREAATARIETSLAGWHYPEGFVRLLAEASWNVSQENDLRTLQGFVFNTCMFPKDMVSRFYGIPADEGAGGSAGAPVR